MTYLAYAIIALGVCAIARREWKRHQPGPWFARRGGPRSSHG
jgi:hypothetical protein